MLAESVIALIGAELAAPGRDPAFPAYAAERLLGGLTPTGPTEVTATTDWVFFARRRTRTCAGQQPPPVRTRTYRLFHRRTDDRIRTTDDVLRGLNTARARASDLGFDPVATVDFVAGEVTLRSVAADLRTGWLAADRGSEIVLAGVGDFADSDGETIALGRLATVRSVLADLADSTNARIEYLPDIPTEFHQPGLDGAMFTVGTVPVQTCVLVYRLQSDAFNRLLEVLRQSGDTISREQAIAQAEVQPDVFVVQLVNDEVVDPDSLRANWQGVGVLEGVLAVPSTSLGDLATWRTRAGRVGDVIGLPTIDEEQITAQTEDCGAILIVAVT